MEYLIIGSVLFAVLGAMIGGPKGTSGTGFILGLLFGPLGVLIVFFLQGDRKKCQFCAELIKNEAIVCPHCQREVQIVVEPSVPAAERRSAPVPPVDLDHAIEVMKDAMEEANRAKKK